MKPAAAWTPKSLDHSTLVAVDDAVARSRDRETLVQQPMYELGQRARALALDLNRQAPISEVVASALQVAALALRIAEEGALPARKAVGTLGRR